MEGKIIEAYRVGDLIFNLDKNEGVIKVSWIAEEADMEFKGETKNKETVNLLNDIKEDVDIKTLVRTLLSVSGKSASERFKDIEETFKEQHTRDMLASVVKAMGEVEDD